MVSVANFSIDIHAGKGINADRDMNAGHDMDTGHRILGKKKDVHTTHWSHCWLQWVFSRLGRRSNCTHAKRHRQGTDDALP